MFVDSSTLLTLKTSFNLIRNEMISNSHSIISLVKYRSNIMLVKMSLFLLSAQSSFFWFHDQKPSEIILCYWNSPFPNCLEPLYQNEALVLNRSYENNEFDLHCEISFSNGRIGAQTSFENEFFS